MNQDDYLTKRIEFLSALKGTWLWEETDKTIIFTVSEHISPTGDGFQVTDGRKSEREGYEEPYPLNFFWTNTVLRVYFEEKQCVVCLLGNRDEIGFFQSILTCNQCKDEDLLIKFKKIIK